VGAVPVLVARAGAPDGRRRPRISSIGPPAALRFQPHPAVTTRVWPRRMGCARSSAAPGLEGDAPRHEIRAGSGRGWFRGSMRTAPVKYWAGPLAGRAGEPLRLISMVGSLSAAGRGCPKQPHSRRSCSRSGRDFLCPTGSIGRAFGSSLIRSTTLGRHRPGLGPAIHALLFSFSLEATPSLVTAQRAWMPAPGAAHDGEIGPKKKARGRGHIRASRCIWYKPPRRRQVGRSDERRLADFSKPDEVRVKPRMPEWRPSAFRPNAITILAGHPGRMVGSAPKARNSANGRDVGGLAETGPSGVLARSSAPRISAAGKTPEHAAPSVSDAAGD